MPTAASNGSSLLLKVLGFVPLLYDLKAYRHIVRAVSLRALMNFVKHRYEHV